MRYARILCAATLGMLALAALFAGAASAAEGSLLGASGEGTTKDNGSATLESTGGGIAVKCTSSEGRVAARTSTTATVDELFLGCTAGGFKCTGLKDTTSGSILWKYSVQYFDITLGGKLTLAAVYTLTEPVHLECLGVLTEIRGSIVGVITNANGEQHTTVTTSFVGKEGKNEVTEVEGVSHHLESETGGSAFVETSVNQNVTTTGNVVEVMY